MDKKQRAGLFLLQIAVSVGLLTYLFWSIDDEDDPATLISNISDWNFLTAFWLVAALVLTFLSFVIGTLRWASAVDALGIKVNAPDAPGKSGAPNSPGAPTPPGTPGTPATSSASQSFRRLFPHFMAGQFMSNFLPTTIGGDILRVSRLNRTAKDAPKSFASVVIDRLGGWVALPIICLVGLGWNQGLRELGAPTRTAFFVAVLTLVVLALVVYLMSHNVTGRWLGRRRGVLRYMHALHLGFDGFKSKPRDALYLVLSALLYQFALVLAVGCAAEAFGVDEIGLTAVMAFLPVVLIIQALPISIGGLGVREGLFVFFFTKLGVSDAEATLLGLFLGAMVLVCSLIGVGPLVFSGRRSRRMDRHADVTQEMQDTLEELDAMSPDVSDELSSSAEPGTPTALAPPSSPALPSPTPVKDYFRQHQSLRHKIGLRWWAEVIVIGAFYGLYSLTRNLFGSGRVSWQTAFGNAKDVIAVERFFGLYQELRIQEWFIDWELFIRFWNVFYGFFHFGITAVALVWLYVRFPSDFARWRTIGLITTGLGLVGYALFPLMPPRLLGASVGEYGAGMGDVYTYVDTVKEFGGLWQYDSGALQSISNQYAAMPSMHFAWALWSTIVIYPRVRRWLPKLLMMLYPWATLFSIVVTANHFWLDAAGGAGAVLLAYFAGTYAHRRWARFMERSPLARDSLSPPPLR